MHSLSRKKHAEIRLPPLQREQGWCIISSDDNDRAAIPDGRDKSLTEKELRRLRRTELLELLVEQGRIVERLQKEVTALRSEAEERRISIEKAGSIAEASLSLTKIFEDAEEASKLYKENIERRSEDQDRINALREEESKKRAEQLIMTTAKKCREMEAATAQKCRQMLEAAAKRAGSVPASQNAAGNGAAQGR